MICFVCFFLIQKEDEEKDPSVRGISDKALEIWNWRDTEQTLRFDFDAYLDSNASQRAVYVRCVKPLLSHAINGQNASVFAYGPTGTGKINETLTCKDEFDISFKNELKIAIYDSHHKNLFLK